MPNGKKYMEGSYGEFRIRYVSVEDLIQQLEDIFTLYRNDFRAEETPRDHPMRVAGGGAGGWVAAGGPTVHPPEARERISTAAAAGKEALAKQRLAQAAQAETPAPPAETPPAKRKRAARAKPNGSEDLSGDREEGDTLVNPDEEPADPLVPEAPPPPAGTRTPREKREAVVEALQRVWAKNKNDVLAITKHFGVKVIPSVPDDRTDELWTLAEALCRKWGVPFVGENEGEEGMV